MNCNKCGRQLHYMCAVSLCDRCRWEEGKLERDRKEAIRNEAIRSVEKERNISFEAAEYLVEKGFR